MSQPIRQLAEGLFGKRFGRLRFPLSSSIAGRRLSGNVSRTRRRVMGMIEPLEPRVVLAGDVMITELMASNDSTLNDEDGQSSDWVELLNASHAAVDLDGWYLTDDSQDLTKWQFPTTQLAAGESIVVFASGKDRAIAGAELHTDFRLSSGGEFLAIVQPDGTSIADQYDPFPQQYSDVSYGPEQEVVAHPLVTPGASGRVLLPSAADQDVPAATWTALDYDDTSWSSANMGVDMTRTS